MAIGDTFPYSVPSVGAAGPQYATDINNVLTELIARTNVKVPFSALSGSSLDMSNVPVQNLRYASFYDQSGTPSGSPTSRFESYAGNIYWVSPLGSIQITSGTGLNASGIGGIGGDYGGGNPALVSFVDASNRYDFWDTFVGVAYAYTRCRGIDISAAAVSANFAQIRYGGAATLTFTLPATLPGANRSVMVISSAGQIAFNDGTNTVTNDLVLGGATKIIHGDRVFLWQPGLGFASAGATFIKNSEGGISCSAGVAGTYTMSISGMQQNWRIKSFVARGAKADAGTMTLDMQRVTPSTGVMASIGSNTTAVVGRYTLSKTLGSPETIVADRAYVFIWTPVANTDFIDSVEITYDVV